MIISRTPFRITFFGGGTDFPLWYKYSRGKVINASINKFCYISVRNLPPFFKYKYRLRYFKKELVNHVNNISHPSIRETIKFLKIKNDLEIVHSADLPAQSGLGASSSFTVGLLNALTNFSGNNFSKKKLFSAAINIEQNLIKEYVGSQDQIAAANGGLNVINFYKNKIEVVPIKNNKNIKDLEKSLFLFFTGYPREASQIEYSKIQKFQSNEIYLKEIFKITENAEIKIQSSKNIVSDFSELLNKYWYFKKKLSSKVSNERIDKLYNLAINSGAYSGKLVGAGGGGFLMFLINPKKRSELKEIFKKYTIVPVEFENEGSQIIYHKRD